MQNDYPHGDYSGQPQWTSQSDSRLLPEFVENATTPLDTGVSGYDDRNCYPHPLVVPNIASDYSSAEPNTPNSQPEFQAVYEDRIQPESQTAHCAAHPYFLSATPADPYAVGLSRSVSDPGTVSQGAISLAYYPQDTSLLPAYSMQNPNTSTVVYSSSPLSPALSSSRMPLASNDTRPRLISGSLPVRGRELQPRVPKACDFWCVISGSHSSRSSVLT